MSSPDGGEKMSAAKRQGMLLGFGAVAVVLIAAIAFVSPNFRNEDARGAIGAVEKHRAPQIAQSDVVLGDEQTKQDHQVIYGDFLADAAALQNIAAEIGSASSSVEARASVAARSLDARYADLRMRYQEYAMRALAAMEQLGAEEQLGKAAFTELAARFNDHLQAQEMEELGSRLAAMADQLGVASVDDFQARNLAAAAADLESFSWGAQETLNAAPEPSMLQNAFEADNLGLRLRVQAESLEAMAKEAMSLEMASRALQAKSLNAQSLANVSEDLLQQADQLEARAVANMEETLAAQEATVDALGRFGQTLNVAMQSLNARASDLDARAVQAARTRLAAFEADLGSRSAAMQARNAFAMRAQLAAVDSHLQARAAVASRANLASAMGDAEGLAQRARALAAKAND